MSDSLHEGRIFEMAEVTAKNAAASFTIPAEPAPMPSVASSDDEDSFDSFEVLSHDLDSESSFVVAEKEEEKGPENSPALPVSLTELGSIRELINTEISQAESDSTELQEQNSMASNGPLSTSGSTSSQLQHLINTNEMLRQNAQQLADSMRKQRDKVQIWQQDVQQYMAKYRDKLSESRALADLLKKENAQLMQDIETYKKHMQFQGKELMTLKARLMKLDANDDKTRLLQQIQGLTDEKTVFVAKILALENQLTEESLKNCVLNETREQLQQSVSTVATLKKALEEKQAEYLMECQRNDTCDDCIDHKRNLGLLEKENETILGLLEKEKGNFKKLEAEFMELSLDRAELDAKMRHLQTHMATLRDKIREQQNLDLTHEENLKRATLRMLETEKKCNKLQCQLEEERRDFAESSSKNKQDLKEAMSTIERQEATMKSLNEQFEQVKLRNDNLIFDCNRLHTEKSALEAECMKYKIESCQPQELLKASADAEEYQHVREQLEYAQKQIIKLEEALIASDGKIGSTQKALEEATARNDELFAFKSQLELYKNDFEMEQSLKKNIQAERDQIAEDLQNLQRRNQQLQDELELLREHSDTVVCNRPSSPADSATAGASFHARSNFVCPKCAFGFGSYQALENHVHRCLDVDGFP